MSEFGLDVSATLLRLFVMFCPLVPLYFMQRSGVAQRWQGLVALIGYALAIWLVWPSADLLGDIRCQRIEHRHCDEDD